MAETMSAETLLKNAGAKSDTVSRETPRPPREQKAPITDDAKPDPVAKLEATQSGEDLSRDEKKLRDQLANLYTMGGMVVSLVDANVAGAIVHTGEDAATAWVLYARTNPKVKRALKTLTESSAVGVLLMAHAPIVMAIVPRVQARMQGTKYEAERMSPEDIIAQAMAEAMAGGTGEPGNL